MLLILMPVLDDKTKNVNIEEKTKTEQNYGSNGERNEAGKSSLTLFLAMYTMVGYFLFYFR